MSLTGSIGASVQGTYSAARALASLNYGLNQAKKQIIASGVGAGQADLMFDDTRTLALSTSENLDLAGSLVDALGRTLTFVKVKGLYVAAAVGNTNDVVVGGAASNAFVGPFGAAAHTMAVKPGGFLCLFSDAGWPVTPATADLLKVLNGGAGTPVTYDVVIIGTSA